MFAGVVHDSYWSSSPVAKSSQAFYPTEMPKQIRSGRTTGARCDSSKRHCDCSYASLFGQRSVGREPRTKLVALAASQDSYLLHRGGRAAEANQRAFSSVLLHCHALARVAATSSLGSLTCGDSNLRVWERPASAATCARRRRRGGRSPSSRCHAYLRVARVAAMASQLVRHRGRHA